MASEMEKSRITEIQVRMDCNGCVQKIKKALQSIKGIYELYIDLPQQKITIVGWADPEKIVKAIKKTRKSAIICSHTEPPDQPAQPPETPTEGGAPPPPTEATTPPEAEAPPTEPPPQETKTSPEAPDDAASTQPGHEPTRPRDVEEVHVIYHYPPDYGYRYNNYGGNSSSHGGYGGYGGHSISYSNGASFRPEPIPPPYSTHRYNTYHGGSPPPFRSEPPPPPFREEQPPPSFRTETPPQSFRTETPPPPFRTQPPPQAFRTEPPPPQFRAEPPAPAVYATHSYNTHRPSPYVTQYEYVRQPPPSPSPPLQQQYGYYSRPVPYSEEFNYYDGNGSNGNITSVFSEENPNSCTIV